MYLFLFLNLEFITNCNKLDYVVRKERKKESFVLLFMIILKPGSEEKKENGICDL
jgi:hypothetical protein